MDQTNEEVIVIRDFAERAKPIDMFENFLNKFLDYVSSPETKNNELIFKNVNL